MRDASIYPEASAARASVEHRIADGETHPYSFTLDADTVLFVDLDELGADVTAATFDPDGRPLATVDSPFGGMATEHVRIDATRAGTYRVDITAGAYSTRPSGRTATRSAEIAGRKR